MKYLIILCDGMCDYKLKELGNKTILEYANTKYFDYMAENGHVVKIHTTPVGMYPGSDICNLSIFGYDPTIYYTGRSPLEAISIGVNLSHKDTTFRLNIVTLSEDFKKLEDFSAYHIDDDLAKNIIDQLNSIFKKDGLEFYKGLGYRNLMVVRNKDFDILTTPPHDIMAQNIEKYLPTGKDAPFLINIMKKAQEIFIGKNYGKANGIWLWGEGKKPELPTYKTKYKLKGAVIAAVDLIKGIGISAGLQLIHVPGITGFIDTNFEGKAQYAIDALEEFDYIYLHIEAPDEAGHMGNIEEKIKAVENINSRVLPIIIEGMKKFKNYRVLVTPDHPTPIYLKTHVAEPVPAIMYGTDVYIDNNICYNEFAKPYKVFKDGYKIADYFIKENFQYGKCINK
jgi:2,3-bisphosphoglycerate-independent phosphoglycerate mutase